MARDRHSKSTERFDESELQKISAAPHTTPRANATQRAGAARASATVKRPAAHEIRPTCKIHKDELLGLVERARAASDPGRVLAEELEVELQVFDPAATKKVRSTQRSSAKLYQLIVRANEQGIPMLAAELESLTDEEAEALFAARVAQIADGTPPPFDLDTRKVSPEHALDLLEQGITSEPPEMLQSAQPFAHSVAAAKLDLEPELRVQVHAEVTRARRHADTAPMSMAEIQEVSTAAKIVTGQIAPLHEPQPPTIIVDLAAAPAAPAEPMPARGPLLAALPRDYLLLVALACVALAIIAVVLVTALD